MEIPFARLPRLERLRASGKADETEVDNEDDGDDDDPNGKKHSREVREKLKMRGKGKSLKRFVLVLDLILYLLTNDATDIYENNGRTSLTRQR